MKQKTKPLWVVFTSCLSLLMAVAFLASGCNGKDKKDDADATNTTTTTPTTSTSTTTTSTSDSDDRGEALAGATIPFYTLRLDKDSLDKLLFDPITGKARKDIRKIIVQVIDSNTTTSKGTGLIAYAAKQNGDIVFGPVGFITLPNPATLIDIPVVLGDQELPYKVLKDILNNGLGKGDIADRTKLYALKFVPQRDDLNHHLFYVVTKTIAASGSGNTNPSPPATPCAGDGCD